MVTQLRSRRVGRAASAPPPRRVRVAARNKGPRATSFSSLSKTLHRKRVSADVAADKGWGLLYVASPDGEDSKHFNGTLSKHVELHAVNRSNVALSPELRRRVVLHEHCEVLDVLKGAGKDSFSHVWLDLTSNDVSVELMEHAIRCAAHKVYVVVSCRGRHGGFAEARARLEARAAFFQVRITHEETYVGAGGKRSMLLVVLDTVKKRGCAKAHPRIGHPVWTEVTKSTPLCDNYAYVRENGRFYYTGRVVDADLANGVAGVQYYDMHMKLATRRSAAPSRTNQVSVRNITFEPLVEWLPVEEVMANIGTRHGDA